MLILGNFFQFALSCFRRSLFTSGRSRNSMLSPVSQYDRVGEFLKSSHLTSQLQYCYRRVNVVGCKEKEQSIDMVRRQRHLQLTNLNPGNNKHLERMQHIHNHHISQDRRWLVTNIHTASPCSRRRRIIQLGDPGMSLDSGTSSTKLDLASQCQEAIQQPILR